MASDQRLTKRQKNDVLAALTENDLDPSSFNWTDEQVPEVMSSGHRVSSRITHVPSGYYAQFDYLDLDGTPYFQFSPGFETRADRYTSHQQLRKWANHAPYVQAWAQRLKAELDAPDMWAWAGQAGLLSAPEADEDRFSPDEVDQLRGRIEEARRDLLEHASAPSEIEAVNDRLDYLVAATQQHDRRAWFFLAVGVVVQLALQIALPPDVATHVMQTLVRDLPPLIHR